MRARQAAATWQAWLEAQSSAHLQEWLQEVFKKITFSVVQKCVLGGPQSAQTIPGGRFQPENYFSQQKQYGFITTRARQAAAPWLALLEECSLAHLQKKVQEIGKMLLCCKQITLLTSSVSPNGTRRHA